MQVPSRARRIAGFRLRFESLVWIQSVQVTADTPAGLSHIQAPHADARQTPRAGVEGGRARSGGSGQQRRLEWRCVLAACSGACLGSKTLHHGCEEHAGGQAGLVERPGWESGMGSPTGRRLGWLG